jgi:hypothetical protein
VDPEPETTKGIETGKIYAYLVRECHLTYEQISGLTDSQIFELCRPPEENEAGEGKVMVPDTLDTFRQRYTRIWLDRGKSLDWIRDLWAKEHPEWRWVEPDPEWLKAVMSE